LGDNSYLFYGDNSKPNKTCLINRCFMYAFLHMPNTMDFSHRSNKLIMEAMRNGSKGKDANTLQQPMHMHDVAAGTPTVQPTMTIESGRATVVTIHIILYVLRNNNIYKAI
jgi:hypothetical protein